MSIDRTTMRPTRGWPWYKSGTSYGQYNTAHNSSTKQVDDASICFEKAVKYPTFADLFIYVFFAMAVPSNQLSAEPKRELSYPCPWKEGTFTPAEIFNQELPIVAMAKKTTTADKTIYSSNFKTMQPMLLFSSTVKTKVEARSIVSKKESASFTEAGDRLVIPEDYAGKTTSCAHRNRN